MGAYQVHDGDEGYGIVFAPRAASAKVKGARELDTEAECVEVTRIRWADQYAPGPVPKLVQIEHGWRWECDGCYRWVAYEEAEEDEEPIEPVEIGGGLYCNAACHDRHAADWKRRYAAMWWVAATTAADLRRVLPDAVLTGDAHCYVTQEDGVYVGQQCKIPFTFPGCKIAPAHWCFHDIGAKPGPSICNGDLVAWNAWRGHPVEEPA